MKKNLNLSVKVLSQVSEDISNVAINKVFTKLEEHSCDEIHFNGVETVKGVFKVNSESYDYYMIADWVCDYPYLKVYKKLFINDSLIYKGEHEFEIHEM